MSVQVDSTHVKSHFKSEEAERINILQAISASYSPGETTQNVGHPKSVGIAKLDALGAKRHTVKGDGSCWSRALWQCVFSQILDNDKEFNRFINKIANPQEGYDIPQFLAKDVLHVLYKLKCLDESSRIDYLNHTNVDDTLVFFMRHVAAEFMRNNFEFYSEEEIREIKANKHKYGGPEINAFVRYFGVETHTIAKNVEGQWTYQVYGKNGEHQCHLIDNLAEQSIKLPKVCIFGANDYHFEALSFSPDEEVEGLPANLTQSITELGEQVCQDHELALKLHAEINADHLQMKKDEVFAKSLQRRLLEQTEGEQKPPEPAVPQPAVVEEPKQPEDVKDKPIESPQPEPTNNSSSGGFWSGLGSFFSSIWDFVVSLFIPK